MYIHRASLEQVLATSTTQLKAWKATPRLLQACGPSEESETDGVGHGDVVAALVIATNWWVPNAQEQKGEMGFSPFDRKSCSPLHKYDFEKYVLTLEDAYDKDKGKKEV